MTTTVRRILYATDLSPASEPAWAETQLLGGLLGAEVLVLHVVAPVFVPEGYFPPRVYKDLLEAALRQAEDALDRLVDAASGRSLRAATRVEEGVPAERIQEVARAEAVDLIVMGTHGRTGFRRLVLGSVADRVVRDASCPVVTVRAEGAGAALEARGLARICYATDFSASAQAAWAWVLTLAEAAGANVDLLHVTPRAIADRELPAEALGRLVDSLREEGEDRAEAFLKDSPLPRERIRVVIPSGAPADQVVTWAQARSADMIVMGTRGWSGLVRWMLGSVAHRVIQIAPCPVLTVGVGTSEERSHGL